jgi:ketosteroid isomerase-like protein
MEFVLRMTRLRLSISALLLSCSASIAFAQAPAPAAGQNAAAPAATAPVNVTTTASPEVREFQKIEDNWSESVNNRDQYGLELVMSPLFVDVSATGDITTRNQQVAMAIGSEDKTLHIDQRVITVRMLGDVAVANGTYALHHRVGTAEANEKGIFTHVYEKTHGGWLCINSQRTILREEANGKQQKKQSAAEMPFHIPLFSKSEKTSE